MKVLITGATGFVGKKLVARLLKDNHEVNVLTRDALKSLNIFKSNNVHHFEWKNTEELPPADAFKGVQGAIHLMGENIGESRWSEAQKEKLYRSRVTSTNKINEVLIQNNIALDFFISGSAIGIYGSKDNQVLTEDSSPSDDYLAKLCIDWEEAANKIKNANRIVTLRTSLVLDLNGGALKKMLLPFKLNLGGTLGNGNQFMSFIHLDDLCELIVKIMNNNNFKGPINAVSNEPITNYEFTKALGKNLNRLTPFPVPSTVLKLALGEMSQILLDSQRVKSNRFEELQFHPQYKTADDIFKKIFHHANP